MKTNTLRRSARRALFRLTYRARLRGRPRGVSARAVAALHADGYVTRAGTATTAGQAKATIIRSTVRGIRGFCR